MVFFGHCRILALVKDAGSSITLEKIIENHKLPTTYGYSSRNVVDKSLTLGKVEVSIEVCTSNFECVYCSSCNGNNFSQHF